MVKKNLKAKLLIRLDDASPYMDRNKWQQIENILDKYQIRPIVAIIPENKDKDVVFERYQESFWSKAKKWQDKGWGIALHGYDHLFITKKRGLIPRNNYSEFAGVPYEIQKEKILKGYYFLKKKGLNPLLWVAPAHSFDNITLKVLRKYTDIAIISDGLAVNPYKKMGFNWIPQQVCHVPKRKFGLWTICLHPNNMEEDDFFKLDNKISTVVDKFISYENIKYRQFRDIGDWLFYIYYIVKRM